MGGMNMNDIASMMNNPMVQSMMQNMLSNPQMLQGLLNDPMIRNMAQSNPRMASMLNNP